MCYHFAGGNRTSQNTNLQKGKECSRFWEHVNLGSETHLLISKLQTKFRTFLKRTKTSPIDYSSSVTQQCVVEVWLQFCGERTFLVLYKQRCYLRVRATVPPAGIKSKHKKSQQGNVFDTDYPLVFKWTIELICITIYTPQPWKKEISADIVWSFHNTAKFSISGLIIRVWMCFSNTWNWTRTTVTL